MKNNNPKYCSYVFVDKTTGQLLANGEGRYDVRLRPLEITFENTNSDGSPNQWESISSSKTSSAINIMFAKMMGHEVVAFSKRFENKEDCVAEEAKNHKIYGVTGEHTRRIYIDQRIQKLGWGNEVEDIKNSYPYVYTWIKMVLCNGDDIKRSFVKKVIDDLDGLKEFVNLDV